jgi:hypothetical protein
MALVMFFFHFCSPHPNGFAASDSDKSKFSSIMFELFLIEYTVGRGLGIACNTLIVLVYQFCCCVFYIFQVLGQPSEMFYVLRTVLHTGA